MTLTICTNTARPALGETVCHACGAPIRAYRAGHWCAILTRGRETVAAGTLAAVTAARRLLVMP